MAEVIPSAENSVSKMLEIQHDIAEEHTPLLPSTGKVLTPPTRTFRRMEWYYTHA